VTDEPGSSVRGAAQSEESGAAKSSFKASAPAGKTRIVKAIKFLMLLIGLRAPSIRRLHCDHQWPLVRSGLASRVRRIQPRARRELALAASAVAATTTAVMTTSRRLFPIVISLVAATAIASPAFAAEPGAAPATQQPAAAAPTEKKADPMSQIDEFIAKQNIDKTKPGWRTKLAKPPLLTFEKGKKIF